MLRAQEATPLSARQAVVEAVQDWRARRNGKHGESAPASPRLQTEHVLHSLPRREQLLKSDESQQWLPYYQPLSFETTLWRSFLRLFTWLGVLLSILSGNLFDQLLRRDAIERRARRVRQALERAGGTFVKFGQQAAMRIDLLPWAYCVELSKMLDRMAPFPVERAFEAIERLNQRPWQETFAVFDPTPIGSASIACVFQATLKDGSKVVVKVRRPGIAELFLADLKVLDWICWIAEFLTIFRPGFTRNLRAELRELLMEELDFRREARFQDTFRRNVVNSKRDFFTAPRVYFEHSGDEVLVQEFVSGLWLWEVISAVEHRDPHGLALLRQLNIDPALVARRILWAAFWSMDEHVFFHADPHPANILIRPNNEITFIDFGSCGSFNNQQRFALEQMVLSMRNQDAETMARASLSLMEPLPPIDIAALVKFAQEEYMHVLHTFNTPARYTEYWERTSARQWMAVIRVARMFNIPMNLHMLRMIRATLLYDSIVLRLDNQLDRYEEYAQFMKSRAKLVKRKWRKRLRENSGDDFFRNVEEIGQSLNDLMIGAQTTLGRPLVNFGSTVDKWIFSASVFSRMAGRIILVTILAMVGVHLGRVLVGAPVSFFTVLGEVVTNQFYHVFLVLAAILNIRHILFRLRERDGGANTK
jgi:predicted unusual protein kinase regulating ubiquinone biosynthesis (AarF/ABC1/UbiB family)